MSTSHIYFLNDELSGRGFLFRDYYALTPGLVGVVYSQRSDLYYIFLSHPIFEITCVTIADPAAEQTIRDQ